MGTENEDNNAKPEPLEKSSEIGNNKSDDAEVTYSDVVMVSVVSTSSSECCGVPRILPNNHDRTTHL